MSDMSMLINGLKVTAEKAPPSSAATRSMAASPHAPGGFAADAVMAVEAAAEAFKTWSETGPSARRALLLKAPMRWRRRRRNSSRRWPPRPARRHVGRLQRDAGRRHDPRGRLADHADQRRGDSVRRAGQSGHGVRQPAGVVLGIAPWNAPVILGVRAIATPLACGNTVIFKGSENCPRTHQLIVEAFADAGFPPGVVNYITNAPVDAGAVVEAMVAHPAVRRVNFTGSTKVGKIIAMTCAKYLKPVVLELGGKAPLVVLDDANIDDAVNAAAFGSFANSGQICMSTERIIVDQKIGDAFVKKFAAKASALRSATRASPSRWCWLGHRHGHGRALQCADRRRARQGRQAGLRRQGENTLMPRPCWTM